MNFRHLTLLAVLLLAACSSKKQDAPNTYRNDRYGFSIVPPSGWTMVTADSAADFLRQHEARLLSTTAAAFRSPVSGRNTWVVAWVKTDAQDGKFPVLWVLHSAVGLPQVGPTELGKSRAAIRAKCSQSGWRDYTEEAAKISEVDGLKAVNVDYSGTFENTFIRVAEMMIPSRNMTHFVAISGEIRDWETYRRLFGEAVFSFKSFGQK
jgi:hypothetical protein